MNTDRFATKTCLITISTSKLVLIFKNWVDCNRTHLWLSSIFGYFLAIVSKWQKVTLRVESNLEVLFRGWKNGSFLCFSEFFVNQFQNEYSQCCKYEIIPKFPKALRITYFFGVSKTSFMKIIWLTPPLLSKFTTGEEGRIRWVNLITILMAEIWKWCFYVPHIFWLAWIFCIFQPRKFDCKIEMTHFTVLVITIFCSLLIFYFFCLFFRECISW